MLDICTRCGKVKSNKRTLVKNGKPYIIWECPNCGNFSYADKNGNAKGFLIDSYERSLKSKLYSMIQPLLPSEGGYGFYMNSIYGAFYGYLNENHIDISTSALNIHLNSYMAWIDINHMDHKVLQCFIDFLKDESNKQKIDELHHARELRKIEKLKESQWYSCNNRNNRRGKKFYIDDEAEEMLDYSFFC